jgi:hypothetical protein
MKILIAGNSQVAPLKQAYWQAPQIVGSLGEVHFFAINGGIGPAFTINSGCLAVAGANRPPPFVDPKAAIGQPVVSYDVVIVCALGFIDGGTKYPNVLLTKQGILFEFGPKENQFSDRLLSSGCYKQVIGDMLLNQPGFRFLATLRENFAGRIIVQPFPLLSSAIPKDPNWPMNQMYERPLDAHRFFQSRRDEFLAEFCSGSMELLPYPRSEWTDSYFTPDELMRSTDGVHMNEAYGKMVLEQVAEQICRGRAE